MSRFVQGKTRFFLSPGLLQPNLDTGTWEGWWVVWKWECSFETLFVEPFFVKLTFELP